MIRVYRNLMKQTVTYFACLLDGSLLLHFNALCSGKEARDWFDQHCAAWQPEITQRTQLSPEPCYYQLLVCTV